MIEQMDKYKLVEFDKYCPTCEHWKDDFTKDPCDMCIAIPARIDSHRPEFYEQVGSEDE